VATISLQLANSMIAETLARALTLGLKPLSVAVLDAGGHLIAFQRQDGSSNLRPQIAVAKAAGALALGISSRRIGEIAAERPAFVAAVTQLGTGMVPAAGGVIVCDAQGVPIGAVGVTGDTSDNDEACALAAIAAAGLSAQA
jgi:uncharacterized protein GlcG (DUF336 family)